MDKNQDGVISRSEYGETLTNLTERQVKFLFAKYDKDNNRRISREEFTSMMEDWKQKKKNKAKWEPSLLERFSCYYKYLFLHIKNQVMTNFLSVVFLVQYIDNQFYYKVLIAVNISYFLSILPLNVIK